MQSPNQAFWERKKKEYAHHAVTVPGLIRPELLTDALGLKSFFIACPIDGEVFWGFLNKEDWELFCATFHTLRTT